MLKIETRLDPVAIMGDPVKSLPNEADAVVVSAHHIYKTWITIDFHGRNVTVDADELRRAITNACNHD
jgi:hypothetical protein